MPRRMSTIVEAVPQLIASATLHVDTSGVGFTDITENAVAFTAQVGAGDGVLLVYLRHTSASLTIQENADPDVQADLLAALDRLAPEDAPWVHDAEGPTTCRLTSRRCSVVSRCRSPLSRANLRSGPGRASN